MYIKAYIFIRGQSEGSAVLTSKILSFTSGVYGRSLKQKAHEWPYNSDMIKIK